MKYIHIIILYSLSLVAHSQKASPKLISSSGGSFSNNSHQLDWSVGETTIGTFTNDKYTLTHGFHQNPFNIDALQITSIFDDIELTTTENCEVTLSDYTSTITTNGGYGKLTIVQTPVAGSVISGSSNTVKLNVTDELNTSTDISFNLSVVDKSKPEITSIHENVILSVSSDCEAELPDYTASVVAIDNCDANLSIVQTPVAGTIITNDVNPVSLIAIDASGNETEIIFDVAVIDDTAPEIICPEDITINVAPGSDFFVTPSDVIPQVADNCGIATTIINNEATLEGIVLPEGLTTVTWTATDVAGNSSSCSFGVTVLNGPLNVDNLKQHGISAFPNPVQDQLNVTLNSNQFDRLIISDLSGKTLLLENQLLDAMVLDLEKFKSGIYILTFVRGDKQVSSQIIKQ